MTKRRPPTSPNAQSGKSAPRDLLSIENLWLEISKRPIKVRKDGVEQNISILQAIVQKQAETALKGSTHAQGQILKAIQRAERLASKQADAEVEEGFEILSVIKNNFKTWLAAGNDPNLCTPHPDDFKVEKGVGWSIDGPVDQPDLVHVLKQCHERDLFYGQAKLEERLADKTSAEWQTQDPTKRPGAVALVTFHMIDRGLPERFKATFADILALESNFARMTKRELLKHMYEAWRSAGHRVPRGKQLPAFMVFSELTDQLSDLLKQAGLKGADLS